MEKFSTSPGVVTPATIDYDGDDPLAEVLSVNLKRRHLTSGQLAVLALDLLPLLEAEAKERQTLGKELPKAESAKRDDEKAAAQAARVTGSNRQYVSDAKKLAEVAPDKLAEVRAGRTPKPSPTFLGGFSRARARRAPDVQVAEAMPRTRGDAAERGRRSCRQTPA